MGAWFEKVSETQYQEALGNLIDSEPAYANINYEDSYSTINVPKRATVGSAGYDFFAPFDFELKAGGSIKIPTGIRIILPDFYYLMCVPRSGLGFKYRLQLDNSVGIIDSDYCRSDNEGHIFAKLTNDGREGKAVSIKQGQAFMQGVISRYYVVDEDMVVNTRNGGFGSTGA